MLWNLEGNPAVSGQPLVQDAASLSWSYDAVNWATKSKVINGYPDDDNLPIFGPWDGVTREQAVAILMNWSHGTPGSQVDFARFPDASMVSGWANGAVAWGVNNHIVGNSGSINPKGVCTRAELAAMIKNAYENVLHKDDNGSNNGSNNNGSNNGGQTPVDPSPGLSTTVVATKSGKKYHYNWCPTIQRSKNLRSMTAAQAKASGLTACNVCNPPA